MLAALRLEIQQLRLKLQATALEPRAPSPQQVGLLTHLATSRLIYR